MPQFPVTLQDLDDLLRFLPLFNVPGRSFAHWPEPTKPHGGALTFPYPEYPDDVEEFYRLAGSSPWNEYGYSPQESSEMFADPDRIQNATLLEFSTCNLLRAQRAFRRRQLGILDRKRATSSRLLKTTTGATSRRLSMTPKSHDLRETTCITHLLGAAHYVLFGCAHCHNDSGPGRRPSGR